MINLWEFRMGNYVLNAKGRMFQIISDDFPQMMDQQSFYSPAPITEKMMEECEFEKVGAYWWDKDYLKFYVDGNRCTIFSVDHEIDGSEILTQLKTVKWL